MGVTLTVLFFKYPAKMEKRKDDEISHCFSVHFIVAVYALLTGKTTMEHTTTNENMPAGISG